ncbi:MAG: hypothetical protein ACI83W_000821 [Marinoscillum sp.]|jgi:hypothetical protein
MNHALLSFFVINLFSINAACSQDFTFHSDFESYALSSNDPLKILLASDPTVDFNNYKVYEDKIEQTVERIKSKIGGKTTERLLEKAFYLTHKKKLKWYTNYVTLADLLENGTYDCLTGTAFFAVILKQLDISFEIYEYDYHVLIVATLDNERYLFESTDPFFGFEKEEKVIDKMLEAYSLSKGKISSNEMSQANLRQYESSHENKITLLQLAGLQYFNLAIDAYNKERYPEASNLLAKAEYLYPSSRMYEISLEFEQHLAINF